jgi:Fe-S oxidoreductase
MVLANQHVLYETFPNLQRVSSYSAPQDILHKSVEELIQLKEAGLKLLYYGMESGDDIVLRAVKKGVTGEQAVEAGKRVTASGIKLSLMFPIMFNWQELCLRTKQCY